jgi:23S rRNA (cytidine1920-2'-O)/16S rRNA (cytidine1409-2'-O)-methyltransferase
MRIDRLVVERGLAPTREKARRLVLAGEVLVGEQPVTKAGALVEREAPLRLRNEPSRFVGRGGEKLSGALEDLQVDPRGARALDIGASTGGFTDCLLQRGALSVVALDVGRGQLDWKLRSDPRVEVVEGVNARTLALQDFPGKFDLVTIDVSFISLERILPAVARLLREESQVLALVKPQFELSRREVGAGGVVREPALHLKAVLKVAEAARGAGLGVAGLAASRVSGMEGNREFFFRLGRGEAGLSRDALSRLARRVCGCD